MHTALREAARIKGDDAIGFPQLIDHLSDEYLEQRAMVPEGCANEVLQDLSLDI